MTQNLPGTDYRFLDPDDEGLRTLPCTFTKISQKGQPALLARIQIYLQTSGTQALNTLLHHVDELNMRLPMLRVSVRLDEVEGYMFVLHGLTRGTVNRLAMTQFLERLTQDLKFFMSYMQVHNLTLVDDVYDSSVEWPPESIN